MNKQSKIYIAGHKGLLGSSLERRLRQEGFNNLVLKTREELDLRNQKETEIFFRDEMPEYVFLAAAKVGGIKANTEFPANFIYDNLQIQNNVIHSSWKYGVKKLLFFGSNCMYPSDCSQPIKEECFFSGNPEKTNESYAAAKISGIEMCQAYNQQYGTNFISVVPASIFGENDNFDFSSSHFTAAVIRRFHEAKLKNDPKITLWGSGKPKREIIYVDDVADASLFLMENYDSSNLINIGYGRDYTIREISDIVKDIIDFRGEIEFDCSKPDGVMQKLIDSGKINSLGWTPQISIEEGLKRTYEWFKRTF